MNQDLPVYSDLGAVRALTRVIGGSRWEAVALAHGILALSEGAPAERAAGITYERGLGTRKAALEAMARFQREGFVALLEPRKKTGSAENPVTKLFPAMVTEERFLEIASDLCHRQPALSYKDERETGHSLVDFSILSEGARLPINVKTASTRFAKARDLVGLCPEDCIPIPVYKASAALETEPNLLYVVSVDFSLVAALDRLLPVLLAEEERIVWDLLNRYGGSRLRSAEDAFVFATVRKYWERISEVVQERPFHAISARKSMRVLQTKPKRTPGIGLRAWGTGANAEVNVHVSVQEDTTAWNEVSRRIEEKGLCDVLRGINRRRQELVYDPEI